MSTLSQNLAHWERQINEQKKSGLKVEDWCNEHGVSRYQYYYWYRRIQKSFTINQSQSPAFAEISPDFFEPNETSNDNLTNPDFQIIYNGIKVIVPSMFQPDSLAGLMKVLQKL